MSPSLYRGGILFLALIAASPLLRADVIETVDGSTIRGRILSSRDGIVRIETEFAGEIKIRQEQVQTLFTESPLYLALDSGNIVSGRVAPGITELRVATGTRMVSMSPGAISAIWREGDLSPAEMEAEAARRKWSYELALDLNGRSGNSDRTFVGLSGRAVLEGPSDRLILAANYARAEENDETTQDQGKAGVDYSNFFAPKVSWYARTEIGYDRPQGLDLRVQTAAGLGYSFIKRREHKLEARAGLSYRHENFIDPLSEDVDVAGVDLGILHTMDSRWGRLTQNLTLTPSFQDLGNFVLVHDSALDLPVNGGKLWKVRVGVRTDYKSEDRPGFENTDWTYYSQLVLTWK